MVLTFMLGALAGLAVPHVEGHVKQALDRLAPAEIEVAAAEVDMLTLLLLLLAAAVLTGGEHAAALILGALAGIFGQRVVAATRNGRGER
jgi:hypothetical protein